MNGPDEPLKDDIYSRESPLPGSGRQFRPASTGTNTFFANPITDFVFPFILTHLIFWPAIFFCFWLFSNRSMAEDDRIGMILATTATCMGGASYGWRIGRRFTELTFISDESSRNDAARIGRRKQLMMSVFQAILFPALLWGSVIAITPPYY